jgi:hypothetical protein
MLQSGQVEMTRLDYNVDFDFILRSPIQETHVRNSRDRKSIPDFQTMTVKRRNLSNDIKGEGP